MPDPRLDNRDLVLRAVGERDDDAGIPRKEPDSTEGDEPSALELLGIAVFVLGRGAKEILDHLGEIVGVHDSRSAASETNTARSRLIRAHSSTTTGCQ